MLADLRYAMRQLRKSPGFALTAVLTLALGIGATTAIFTLVHAVLLKSLPVKDPGQLWRVGDNEQCCIDGGLPHYTDPPWDWSLFSYEQYREFRSNTPGFESLAAFSASEDQMAVRRAGSGHPAEPYYSEWVSGNSFDTLGLRAYAGRLLRPSDDRQGAAPVAVMSFQAWEQKFGKDPSVIGASFLINGQPVTVAGIAPPGFYGERLSADPPSFWFPLNLMRLLNPQEGLLDHPELQWLNLIGRVQPRADIAAIQARMQVELQQFLKSPLSKILPYQRFLIPKQYLRLAPGGGGVQRMQDNYKSDLHLLFWISGFVLLIACANLANLMLARSVTQRQQIAVRTALGAPRRRLVQRALLECVLLAVLGGTAGLLVAIGGAKLILYLAFQRNPISISTDPSLAVLGFAFGVSLLTGLLFGVAPAWMAAQADPIDALRGANRSTGHHTMWAQKALVVAQAAISVVLLCAAGFLILSLNKLQHQRFGFETAHRYILQIDPQAAGYKPEQLAVFYRQLHDTLAEIPGVTNVAYSGYSPMSGDNWGEGVYVEGQPAAPPGQQETGASWDRISPGYFDAVGTKLLEGRNFAESDDATSQNVAIVNQAFVKKFLHGKNPIGRHFGDWDPSVTGTYAIVGVVEDAQYWSPNEPIRPMYFLPAAQWTALPPTNPDAADYALSISNSHYMGTVEIETRVHVFGLESDVRRALAEVNPNLMVISFQSFAAQVNLAFSQQNMIAQLTSLFGLLALVLAAIGLYGVTAYAVAQRTSEIGIRMALGADRVRVQRMVLREALLQTGVGLLIGIPAAVLAGHLMASQMFGISADDPRVLTATTVVLGAAALIAAALPARRASHVEPMEALRSE
ncbi:MAG TPA: ABC transporter permease [Acidobacteriaceae bacterium]|nr:ABC transporter permease [Acidobacteriaceae bacterium]